MSTEALGKQFHPNVEHYQSGGMGHRPEDETRSVVGYVPTKHLEPYKEYDRTDESTHPGSRAQIDSLRADLREGKGFHTPLHLFYNHKEQWAVLGEGNHRLAAAREEGVPVLPVRVSRATFPKQGEAGAHATHEDPGWSRPDYPYVPSDIHPSYLNLRGDR